MVSSLVDNGAVGMQLVDAVEMRAMLYIKEEKSSSVNIMM